MVQYIRGEDGASLLVRENLIFVLSVPDYVSISNAIQIRAEHWLH